VQIIISNGDGDIITKECKKKKNIVTGIDNKKSLILLGFKNKTNLKFMGYIYEVHNIVLNYCIYQYIK
jgi:hypothetical protein